MYFHKLIDYGILRFESDFSHSQDCIIVLFLWFNLICFAVHIFYDNDLDDGLKTYFLLYLVIKYNLILISILVSQISFIKA